MHVVIAGGGIGGLVLARELERVDIEADVYEQAGQLREIGAAVALSANAVRELERLGLGERLAEISAPPSALCLRERDGSLAQRAAMADSGAYVRAFGAPYYGVHRVALLALLAADVDPARIHLGRRVESVDPAGELVLDDGERVRADVIVGADGVHSAVRRCVVGADPGAAFSGTIGYRGLVDTAKVPSLPEPAAIQFWAGPGAHLLHYPIGDGAVINFLAVARVAEWTADGWMVPCSPQESVERFAGWHPAVSEMLGAVSESARWALHDRAPLPRWSRGRATLLGDAAHAMLPHQGQGANQTIEDAVALATQLAATAGGAVAHAPAALERYAQRRRGRTARVQAWSRRTADVLHLPDERAAERAAAFADTPQRLAWIHGHDARAAAGASLAAQPAGSR